MVLVKSACGFFRRIVKHILKEITIKKRLTLFFSLLVILPILTLGIAGYVMLSTNSRDITVKHKFELSRSALEEILAIKEMRENFSEKLLTNIFYVNYDENPNNDNHIVDAMQYKSQYYAGDVSRYELIAEINELLRAMMDKDNIKDIVIVGNSGVEFKTSRTMMPLADNQQFKSSFLYKSIMDGEGRNVWVPLNKDIFAYPGAASSKVPYLYLGRSINIWEDGIVKNIGYYIIQLKYERFENVLKRISTGLGEFSLLLDGSGMIMSHSLKAENIGKILDKDILDNIEGKEGYFTTHIKEETDSADVGGNIPRNSFFDGNAENLDAMQRSLRYRDKEERVFEKSRKYLVMFVRDSESGWSIVQYTPYENIMIKSKDIRNFTLILLLACIAIASMFSLILTKNITNPIISLKKAMESFGEGNFRLRVEEDREDEIGRLQHSFNVMANEIRTLLDRIEEAHLQQRKLELNMLEYHINPHFLYNTLDSINWMAQKSGNTDISEIVTALARFFRIGLSHGKEVVKISEEIDHAYYYLTISKIRYKDCLNFEIDVDDSILEYKTLKIILQPIVENAIKYGIYKNRKDQLIQIKGHWGQNEDEIILEVIDNGKGMSREKLYAVKQAIYDQTENGFYSGGIGLKNVNQRIRLYYGESYGLNIESEPGKGTRVIIRIPAVK